MGKFWKNEQDFSIYSLFPPYTLFKRSHVTAKFLDYKLCHWLCLLKDPATNQIWLEDVEVDVADRKEYYVTDLSSDDGSKMFANSNLPVSTVSGIPEKYINIEEQQH